MLHVKKALVAGFLALPTALVLGADDAKPIVKKDEKTKVVTIDTQEAKTLEKELKSGKS